MNGASRFREQLTSEGLGAIASRYGFSSLEATEKWVMDFDAYRLMRKFIPDCTVKGGMAVPFHLRSGVLGRLSVDIDAATALDREDAKKSMDDMFSDTSSIFTGKKLHRPQNPRKNLPLPTYFCNYNTVVGAKKPDVKIDLFYDDTRLATTKKISPPSSAVGVDIDFEVEVYDYYSLIGDKLTTLAFDTIGLRAADPGVPKHVYDIASLARSAGGAMSMGRLGRALEASSMIEIGYAGMNGLGMSDVYDDLTKFRRRLLRPSRGVGLDEPYTGRFSTFGTLMLGHRQRRPQMHATDVMIASVLAEALALVHRKAASETKMGQFVNNMLSDLEGIGAMSPAESGARAKKLRLRHKKNSADYDRIRASPAEHVCLYNCLLDLRDF